MATALAELGGACRCANLKLANDQLRAQRDELQRQYDELDRRYQLLLAQRVLGDSIELASGAVMDPARCEVRRGGQAIRLSTAQWKLLEQLATLGRQTVHQQATAYYGSAEKCDIKALWVLVGRLRQSLNPIGADKDILTTSSGYALARPAARPPEVAG